VHFQFHVVEVSGGESQYGRSFAVPSFRRMKLGTICRGTEPKLVSGATHASSDGKYTNADTKEKNIVSIKMVPKSMKKSSVANWSNRPLVNVVRPADSCKQPSSTCS